MKNLRADLAAMIPHRMGVSGAAIFVMKLLTYPRIWAMLLHRVAAPLHARKLYPLSYALHALQQVLTGAEIHPVARIGPGCCLVHSNGIVVGDKVRIGAGFRCFQGVTLGDNGRERGQPVIGDGVTIYAGAKVLGPITLGDHATVGANAVLLCDVPPGGVAIGIPARVLPAKRVAAAVETPAAQVNSEQS